MVELNHTIVHARDERVSAAFLAYILGLPAPVKSGDFTPVRMDNGVTLDYLTVRGQIVPQHYAYLVSESLFDEVLARLVERGLPYYGGPMHQRPGSTNTWYGGRGVYFDDPDGHALEVLTRGVTS
jgi:hypothetical protein